MTEKAKTMTIAKYNPFSSWVFCFHESLDGFVEPGHALVAISLRAYYDKHGYFWDQTVGHIIKHTLPEFDTEKLDEIMEGVFEMKGTVEKLRAYLISLGMTEVNYGNLT